ncbi:MAG: hybrid sensor histidine kinase/response regulator [Ramlibacter sp.]|jgi:DNA-binding response OmpR family regulator|nr:hybrid sensor histidine kinase/response regulator [Ramlibacter sp.]
MSPRSTHSVLVVDDAESNRYALSRGLRAEGFQTVEAAAGAQALELAEYVSAVVLDVHLPDVHGFEVCRLLRGNPKTARVPIIHVSGVYVKDEHRVAGTRAGADAYLVSPVDTAELAVLIDRLVTERAGG